MSIAIKLCPTKIWFTSSIFDIPLDVIERRYYRGIKNLHQLYMPVCNEWTLVDNMDLAPDVIAKSDSFGETVFNTDIWDRIIQQSHEKC